MARRCGPPAAHATGPSAPESAHGKDAIPFPLLFCAAALAATACGGSKDGPTGAPAPAIQKTASANGDGQTGTVSTALANPLRVLVTLGSTPQAGDTVTWAASGAGASVNPVKAVTDASGIATATWTLGQAAGR